MIVFDKKTLKLHTHATMEIQDNLIFLDRMFTEDGEFCLLNVTKMPNSREKLGNVITLQIQRGDTLFKVQHIFDQPIMKGMNVIKSGDDFYVFGYTINPLAAIIRYRQLKLEGDHFVEISNMETSFTSLSEGVSSKIADAFRNTHFKNQEDLFYTVGSGRAGKLQNDDGTYIKIEPINFYVEGNGAYFLSTVIVSKCKIGGEIEWISSFHCTQIIECGIDNKGNIHIISNDAKRRYNENGNLNSTYNDKRYLECSPAHIVIDSNGEVIQQILMKNDFSDDEILQAVISCSFNNHTIFFLGKMKSKYVDDFGNGTVQTPVKFGMIKLN